VHGTTSVEQGAPGSPRLPQGQPGQRSAIIKGLLFGFEGPSLLGSLTHWMLKNGFEVDGLSRFAQPASLGL